MKSLISSVSTTTTTATTTAASVASLLLLLLSLSSSVHTTHAMPDASTGTPSFSPVAAAAAAGTASSSSKGGGGILHDILYGSSTKSDIVQEMNHHSTFAGTLKPAIGKLLLSKEELTLLVNTLATTLNWEDLILIVAAGWLSVPFTEVPYNKLRLLGAVGGTTSKSIPYSDTYLYVVADNLQQVAKIALAVYAVDVVKMLCIGLGFDFCKMTAFPHAFAQAAYTIWAATRVSYFKKHLFRTYVNRHPDTFGRIQVMNRLADAGIGGLTVFLLLQVLKLEMGVALSGILGLGSIGMLAFGLASKDLTTNILNGLMLSASDRIYEGDSVKFGNGHSGTIVSLGWMETVLRGSDEVMVSIPNGDLLKQHVSNLSRVRYCQVKQQLRFKFKDAEKLPSLLTAIKDEIRLACPHLITDGTRPFRVHWADIAQDHLVVIVDTHYNLKPIGNEYWDNKQRVLQAIDKAIKKVGLTYYEPV